MNLQIFPRWEKKINPTFPVDKEGPESRFAYIDNYDLSSVSRIGF